jgi:plastocyanin
MGLPVIVGLAIGIGFIVLLAGILGHTLREEPSIEGTALVLEFDDASFNVPYPDRTKVYIFSRDNNNNMTIDELDWELGVIAGVQFAYGHGDHFGASKLGVYDVNGTIVVPNATEVYISPDLKRSDGRSVGIEDIHEQQKFGNGVQIGDIMLIPEGLAQIVEFVPAITFVVIEPDIADVDANLELVRASIDEPKLVKVSIPEGAGLPNSGRTYDPQVIKVVLGYNNTVRWVNNDSTYHYIEADNDTDLNFYRETTYANPEANRRNLMDTGDSFLYTFTKAGEIAYHGKPWLRGTVIVGANETIMLDDNSTVDNLGVIYAHKVIIEDDSISQP